MDKMTEWIVQAYNIEQEQITPAVRERAKMVTFSLRYSSVRYNEQDIVSMLRLTKAIVMPNKGSN